MTLTRKKKKRDPMEKYSITHAASIADVPEALIRLAVQGRKLKAALRGQKVRLSLESLVSWRPADADAMRERAIPIDRRLETARINRLLRKTWLPSEEDPGMSIFDGPDAWITDRARILASIGATEEQVQKLQDRVPKRSKAAPQPYAVDIWQEAAQCQK